MPWYFAKDGRQCGPLSDAEFDHATAEGKITPETLVWRQGMPAWLPRSALPAGTAQPSTTTSATAAEASTCCECGRRFASDELVQIIGRPVCAACKLLYLQRLQERAPGAAGGPARGAWQLGKLLILRLGAELPARCVRCNRPAVWSGRITYSWHPAWIYLTFLVNPVVMILVAFFTLKRAVVVLQLCEGHRRKRAIGLTVGRITIAAGIALMAGGWVFGSDFGVIGLLLGTVVTVTGAMISSRASWILTPQRIDKSHVRLKGCCPEFLDRLPPFPGT